MIQPQDRVEQVRADYAKKAQSKEPALRPPTRHLTPQEKVDRIREIHCPTPIPEGKVWMGAAKDSPHETPCQGCSTGDPFIDTVWPCETRRICDGLAD